MLFFFHSMECKSLSFKLMNVKCLLQGNTEIAPKCDKDNSPGKVNMNSKETSKW